MASPATHGVALSALPGRVDGMRCAREEAGAHERRFARPPTPPRHVPCGAVGVGVFRPDDPPGRRDRQTASSTTASRAIATIAVNVSGALRSVSTAKKTSTTAVTARARHDHHDAAAGVRAQPVRGDADEQEDHERAGAADGGDRREVDEVGDDEHDAAGDEQPGLGAEPRARPEERRELPDLARASRSVPRRRRASRSPATAVESSAATAIIVNPESPSAGRAASAIAVSPYAPPRPTVSVPKTPSEIRTYVSRVTPRAPVHRPRELA